MFMFLISINSSLLLLLVSKQKCISGQKFGIHLLIFEFLQFLFLYVKVPNVTPESPNVQNCLDFFLYYFG